jgi:hypothetical protein
MSRRERFVLKSRLRQVDIGCDASSSPGLTFPLRRPELARQNADLSH